jgi:hypothetical protein
VRKPRATDVSAPVHTSRSFPSLSRWATDSPMLSSIL